MNLSSRTPAEVDAPAGSVGKKFCVRYVAKPGGRLVCEPRRDDPDEDDIEENLGNANTFMGLG